MHFAATRRAALTRSGGGVCCTMAHWKTKPWCGCAEVEDKPASVRRLAPRTCGHRTAADKVSVICCFASL